MKYDFCIYAPNEPDYWGQFDNQKELFDYLSLAVPGFVPHEHLCPKECTDQRANYRISDTLIVVKERKYMNEIFFTSTINNQRININSENNVFSINNIPLDAQQLAELSILLFALATQKNNPDLDSCNELVQSFNIPFPTKYLQELVGVETT